MTISQIRSLLYGTAKSLGDVSAVDKAIRTGSLAPIGKRLERRFLGRLAGLILRALTKGR
jgi:hypothetical protein